MSLLSNVLCARVGHSVCYNPNEHIAFVAGGGTESLGFTQPSFETFARKIDVIITPSFVPDPEDAAISRAPTLVSMNSSAKKCVQQATYKKTIMLN